MPVAGDHAPATTAPPYARAMGWRTCAPSPWWRWAWSGWCGGWC